MAQAQLSDIKKIVTAAAKGSAIGSSLKEVRLDFVEDTEGSDFIRITLFLKKLSKVDDKTLQNFVRAVETAMADRDDRFPSIRFSEAA